MPSNETPDRAIGPECRSLTSCNGYRYDLGILSELMVLTTMRLAITASSSHLTEAMAIA